jgi:hypothetical protein
VISRPHNAAGPPLALLVLILLLALGSVGVGYGLWARTLTIEGTVETGKVDAKWSFTHCDEFYPWPGGGNEGEVEGKDVGSFTLDYLRDENGNVVDDQVLVFTIENGYPSYAVDCEVEFLVEGTIPVKVRATTIVPGPGLTDCTVVGNQTKTMTCDELTVIFIDNLGSQFDPPDGGASSVKVHVEQPAEQDTPYTFSVKVCMAQWNEHATADECFAAAPVD